MSHNSVLFPLPPFPHPNKAVDRNEAKSVALAKQRQYLIEKSALLEYRRLGADKVGHLALSIALT